MDSVKGSVFFLATLSALIIHKKHFVKEIFLMTIFERPSIENFLLTFSTTKIIYFQTKTTKSSRFSFKEVKFNIIEHTYISRFILNTSEFNIYTKMKIFTLFGLTLV